MIPGRMKYVYKVTLEEKKQQVIDDLSVFEDPYDRLGYLIEIGRRQPELAAEERNDLFLVEGCMSKLWLVPSAEDGVCHFKADADSSIVKGIAGLLCEFYSGHRAEEILETDPTFLASVGVTQHLTQNRRNALSQMWAHIRRFAESVKEEARANQY